jgi:hypothetical protein
MTTPKIPNATKSNTKDEILAALNIALDVVKAQKETTLNPAHEAEVKRSTEAVAKAEAMVSSNIMDNIVKLEGLISNTFDDLSAKMVEKTDELKTLDEAISVKKKELNNLLEIEVTIDTLAALVNSKIELTKKFDAEQAEKMAKASAELESVHQQIKDALDSYQKEIDMKRAQDNQRRTREEEEYKYNFARTKKLDQDAWSDEKTKRMKELNDKAVDLNVREAAIKEQESHIKGLEAQVAAIPTAIDAAKAQAVKEAEDKVKTSAAFETRYLKRDYEAKIELLNNTVSNLSHTISSKDSEIIDLKAKLNSAYAEIKEMAAKVVDGASDRRVAAAYEKMAADNKVVTGI